MLNDYDITNEYRGKSQEMLNEYDLINKYPRNSSQMSSTAYKYPCINHFFPLPRDLR